VIDLAAGDTSVGSTPLGRTLFAFASHYSQGMDAKFVPSKIFERAPIGSLSPYIDSYVRLLNEESYAPASVRDHVRVIVRFSRSLQRSDCEVRDPPALDAQGRPAHFLEAS
jgi:hypothetical protein